MTVRVSTKASKSKIAEAIQKLPTNTQRKLLMQKSIGGKWLEGLTGLNTKKQNELLTKNNIILV